MAEPMPTVETAQPGRHAGMGGEGDAASADLVEAHMPEVPATPPCDHAEPLAAMRREVARFHERSSAQEEIVRRMQARIEDLQADQVRAMLAPVANELAALHGDLEHVESRDPAAMSVEGLVKEVVLLRARVESALEHLGMELVPSSAGDVFDRRWHAATRRAPTADPSLDRTIARVLRHGFAIVGAERATVPARVVVHQLDAAAAARPRAEGQPPTDPLVPEPP